MDFETIAALQERHPTWRLLRAQNAPLILSFLGGHFVEQNNGATPAGRLADALEDQLSLLRTGDDESRFAKTAEDYLYDWSQPESGWLRRFYPADSDEVHYDATPALERAYSWVSGLRQRAFVGTESRLHTVVDLLRQIAYGTEQDPQARLEVLQQQRDEIDRQIAAAEAGEVDLLSDTAIRDRYQQFAGTARELLSDFREVEENFRGLDRAARERIASWTGSKGALLAELVSSRADISSSDQGASFQAFYDFLLSDDRQDELNELLTTVQRLAAVDADRRLRTIHHDWSEAAERTQQTVRQISEQLRRFLDDQVWLENRRVLDLVRQIEGAALQVRDGPPTLGLEVDLPGVPINLPFERPLYDARPAASVDSLAAPADEVEVDTSALFTQAFVDQARLADNIRATVPERGSVLLSDLVELYPVERGIAEIVGYLALNEDDLAVELDESGESLIDFHDHLGAGKRVRLPRATVSRR
ncbi:DUF3375 domain-containing protein [Microlunatus elymi]|uniref:DUF3375 domain-containing protein n=1 Tax=Microlunatus elymi TaxID=2596828 RepID=A0A516PV98_9ACTN|nr:DUF3375 domain-containing protein [Microlunatus elymi]QDP94871.1 DUF3375 domain-containing protein [Microlunatus elymi]